MFTARQSAGKANLCGLLASTIIVGSFIVSALMDVWREPVWAQGASSPIAISAASKLNSALPGMRTGVLTQVDGRMVKIDHTTYVLSPQALIADESGGLIHLTDGVTHQPVRYWIGIDEGGPQIIQMIVTLLG